MIKGKSILIISRQRWGKMLLSKHNYALAFSKYNRVFFLESPDPNYNNNVGLLDCPDSENIKIIKTGKTTIYKSHLASVSLFKFLMNKRVKKILNLTSPIDIVVSFDDYGLYPFLEQFNAKQYVFFPVDISKSELTKLTEYPNNFLFSISKEVAEKYNYLNKTNIILNHGLSSFWQKLAEENLGKPYYKTEKLKFGYTGNLLKGKIQDTETLKKVITKFKEVEFHFWGPYEQNHSNVGARIKEGNYDWIKFLKAKENVFLHGVFHPKDLVNEVKKMDGFFICKDDAHDHNKSSNSHKITEYLSTGRVVISSHLSAYTSYPNLIAMPKTPSNKEYINIFENVINNIDFFNSEENIDARINFSLNQTYEKNIERLFSTLNAN